MHRIKAVIFDLDDTLHAERGYAFSGFAAVAAAFEQTLGDPTDTARWMRAMFDTEDRPRLFNALLRRRSLPEDEDLIGRMVRTYRGHTPTIVLHADADAALTRLGTSYRLGILTEGRTQTQWLKLKALSLPDRVEKIIVTGDLGSGYEKPDPRSFELMEQELKLLGRDCAYIADNEAKDFIAPNALGWTTIKITRAEGLYRDSVYCDSIYPDRRRHDHPAPNTGAPHHVIDTLDALDELLA